MGVRAKLGLVVLTTVLCFGAAAGAFWYGDYRYSLPTKRPADLQQPPRFSELPVERWLSQGGILLDGRPVLLHFFNPDCPCTKFNSDHVNALHARFGAQVQFVGVMQLHEETQARLSFDFPTLIDRDGRIAAEAGVYSTPQGVLVSHDSALIYRGNYNLSRYCTDPSSEFVRIALELHLGQSTAQDPVETPAYGCELPRASLLLGGNFK